MLMESFLDVNLLFEVMAVGSVLAQVMGCFAAWKEARRAACGWTLAGTLCLGVYLGVLAFALDRPPMQTMGETRLWYAFLLPGVGVGVYLRWRFRWMLAYTTLLSAVFLMLNVLHPEQLVRELPLALQSGWFVPHVLLYMVAYALLGGATVVGTGLCFTRTPQAKCSLQASCQELVRLGLACLTLGMLTGSFWAHEAWGHYWGWDPKETWALVTWYTYIIYRHVQPLYPNRHRWLAALLWLAFLCLQGCWWGLKFLPAAQGGSLHVYS